MVYTISCDIPHGERKGKSKRGPQTYFPVFPTEMRVIRDAIEDKAVQPVAGSRIVDTKQFKNNQELHKSDAMFQRAIKHEIKP